MSKQPKMPDEITLGQFYYSPAGEWFLAEATNVPKPPTVTAQYIRKDLAAKPMTEEVREAIEYINNFVDAGKVANGHIETLIRAARTK